MIRSLYSAATGMRAQQLNIDTIANNLANINTVGYKRGRALFEDLIYQELKAAGSLTATGVEHPTGIQEGLGVHTVGIQKIFEQGSFKYTANELDIAIAGDGFFSISLPDGNVGYTRNGVFNVDSNGDIVTSQGYRLEPNIQVPEGTREISISIQGEVVAYVNKDTEGVQVGEINLTTFINPQGLYAMGENLFLETSASGVPVTGQPGADNRGTLRQFFLEMSNVIPAEEMVDMITAQRAYEMDSKAIQTSDEMLQIVNGLKR